MDPFHQEIRFAIIGCGRIGKRHATSILNNGRCRLVALCDIVPKSELDIAAYQDIAFFCTLDELCNSGIGIDIIVIATPNGLHESQAIQALDRNLDVVIEKPMALTKAGCERIMLKALQKNRQIFCVMQNRYSPPSQWLKEILDKGLLGKIFIVQVNCFWNRDDQYYHRNTCKRGFQNWHGTKTLDGGTLYTQFSHFIDLLYWYFGDVTNLQTKFKDYKHSGSTDFEDSGLIIFDFVDGGIGNFNFSTAVWDKSMESSIIIIAEKGTVKIGGQYADKIEYCHIENYTNPAPGEFEPSSGYFSDFTGSATNHQHVYENIVQVLNGNSSITTTALEGMKVVEIIEKMYDVS
jgi:predicted dehydrogenase